MTSEKKLLQVADKVGIPVEDTELAQSAITAVEHYNAKGDISDLATLISDWYGRTYDSQAVARLVNTRHSVWNSFDKDVSIDLGFIKQIVAETSVVPSSGNRHSYRVYY